MFGDTYGLGQKAGKKCRITFSLNIYSMWICNWKDRDKIILTFSKNFSFWALYALPWTANHDF